MSWKSSLNCLKQMWNNTDAVNTVNSAKTKLETYENRRKSLLKRCEIGPVDDPEKVDKFYKVSKQKIA